MSWFRKTDDGGDAAEHEAMLARLNTISARGKAEGRANPVIDDPIVAQRAQKQFWGPSS